MCIYLLLQLSCIQDVCLGFQCLGNNDMGKIMSARHNCPSAGHVCNLSVDLHISGTPRKWKQL